MRILAGSAAAARVKQIAARGSRYADVTPAVRRIVADVRRRGDHAVRKYSEQWDGLKPGAPLQIAGEDLHAAWKAAGSDLRNALRAAAKNIQRFCEMQKPTGWTRAGHGISLGQVVRPLNSVGCYVPAGRHPLISTLLMTVIPAQVAGVKNIRVVSPRPQADLLAAAAMLGVREFYSIGGAQAIAALACGTESVTRVDKIVGPGNLFVTAAKKEISFDCAIDFLAGPTETVLISDAGSPEFIAGDLVAQAEHDPEALAVFITMRRDLAVQVGQLVRTLSKKNVVACESIRRRGVILVSASKQESFEWSNEIAPEHLTIERRRDLDLVRNAGSVFIGDYSAQAAGDYASGPNHVLPTGGAARFRSGLSVLDFVKLISVQEISKSGLKRIAPVVELLAEREGLKAHADSIRGRSAHA